MGNKTSKQQRFEQDQVHPRRQGRSISSEGETVGASTTATDPTPPPTTATDTPSLVTRGGPPTLDDNGPAMMLGCSVPFLPSRVLPRSYVDKRERREAPFSLKNLAAVTLLSNQSRAGATEAQLPAELLEYVNNLGRTHVFPQRSLDAYPVTKGYGVQFSLNLRQECRNLIRMLKAAEDSNFFLNDDAYVFAIRRARKLHDAFAGKSVVPLCPLDVHYILASMFIRTQVMQDLMSRDYGALLDHDLAVVDKTGLNTLSDHSPAVIAERRAATEQIYKEHHGEELVYDIAEAFDAALASDPGMANARAEGHETFDEVTIEDFRRDWQWLTGYEEAVTVICGNADAASLESDDVIDSALGQYERHVMICRLRGLDTYASSVPLQIGVIGDLAWHAHMLNPSIYHADMMALLKHPLHHHPWPCFKDEEKTQYRDEINDAWRKAVEVAEEEGDGRAVPSVDLGLDSE